MAQEALETIRPRFWRGRLDYFFLRATFLAFFAFLAIAALIMFAARHRAVPGTIGRFGQGCHTLFTGK